MAWLDTERSLYGWEGQARRHHPRRDEALRSVLVVGATAVIRQIRYGRGALSPWLVDLLKRKAPKLAAVALANKIARIAWKLMVSDILDRIEFGAFGRQRDKRDVRRHD